MTFASLFLFEASVLVMLEQGCTLLYEETWFNLLCNGALISCSLLPEVLGSSLLCEDDKQIRMMLPAFHEHNRINKATTIKLLAQH